MFVTVNVLAFTVIAANANEIAEMAAFIALSGGVVRRVEFVISYEPMKKHPLVRVCLLIYSTPGR